MKPRSCLKPDVKPPFFPIQNGGTFPAQRRMALDQGVHQNVRKDRQVHAPNGGTHSSIPQMPHATLARAVRCARGEAFQIPHIPTVDCAVLHAAYGSCHIKCGVRKMSRTPTTASRKDTHHMFCPCVSALRCQPHSPTPCHGGGHDALPVLECKSPRADTRMATIRMRNRICPQITAIAIPYLAHLT